MFEKIKLTFAYPENKWYLQTWFICLSLILCFPISIILLVFHYRNNYLRNSENKVIETDAAQKSLDELLKAIEDGQKRIDELNPRIDELETQKLALEEKCLEYNNYITECNEDSKKFSQTLAKITEMRKEKNDLEICINNMELEKKNLEKTLPTLEQSKNEKLTEISLLKEEIADLEYKQQILVDTLASTNVDFESLEFVDKIKDGIKFEEYVAKMLIKLGFADVSRTPASGDYGIDVLATDNDDVTWGFQCKLYSNTVGVEAIQQALTGKTHYHRAIVAVITNNYFTNEAKSMAKENNVQLWDRDKLERKLKESKKAVKVNL